MNPDVIEAMCRAYWNERGSFKWENEGEQYRESIRQRMRAAVKVQSEMIATKSVPAPGSDPKPVLFSEFSVLYKPKYPAEPEDYEYWECEKP